MPYIGKGLAIRVCIGAYTQPRPVIFIPSQINGDTSNMTTD